MAQLSDICPVCGMASILDVAAVSHNKMRFFFCSEQCRAMFATRPSLYSGKLGDKKSEVLKQRTLQLSDSLDREVAALLIPYLKEVMGVKQVTVENNKVHIHYDLLQVTERHIKKVLAEVGVQLGGGSLAWLRRGWTEEREEIELDNLASPPTPCCNRAPPNN